MQISKPRYSPFPCFCDHLARYACTKCHRSGCRGTAPEDDTEGAQLKSGVGCACACACVRAQRVVGQRDAALFIDLAVDSLIDRGGLQLIEINAVKSLFVRESHDDHILDGQKVESGDLTARERVYDRIQGTDLLLAVELRHVLLEEIQQRTFFILYCFKKIVDSDIFRRLAAVKQ